ncbi:outer membrane beta-barrel protein [Salinimicrobium catena]|uniref:outer membrane beta-barrel protein n=1 Tax=Salinimicrobium catena TaxID=390640 RepID=UPI002FE4F13C
MKLYLTSLLILMGITLGNAQNFTYGLKAGTNFTNGGQIKGHPHYEINNNGIKEKVYWDGISQGQSKTGFHGGAYCEIDFKDFFLRPELVYTSIKSEFTFPNRSSIYSLQRLDVPLLLGYNAAHFLGFYAGPVYSPYLSNSFSYKESTIIKENGEDVYYEGNTLNKPDLPVNLQLGIKSQFSGIGIDLRYEHSLSKSDPEKIDIFNQDVGRDVNGVNVATVEDAALSQIILSLTYDISELYSSKNFRRSRGYSYSRRRRAR